MEAYRTQNRFLNSEIHQVTKLWRRVAEREKALLMKVSGGGPALTSPFLATLQPFTVPSLCLSSLPVSSPSGPCPS